MALLSGGLLLSSFILTACSNLDKPGQEAGITTGGEVKTMPFKATVSKGDPATRVTVDDDLKTLRFEEGDKLYIEAIQRSDVKAVLDITSGAGQTSGAVFEGTLQYEGDTPDDKVTLVATLVGTNNRCVQIDNEGKVTGVSYPSEITSDDEIFSAENSLVKVIQAYSYLTGSCFFCDPSFKLEQQTAFLKFHVTLQTQMDNGNPVKPGTASLEVKNEGSTLMKVSNFKTTEENDFCVVDFVMPTQKGFQLHEACVCSEEVSSSFGGNTQLEGKVYYIDRAIVNYNYANLGDVFFSDGTFLQYGTQGKTAIGVIAYLGNNSYSENGAELHDGSFLNSSGLVLCLKNIADVAWAGEATGLEKAYEPNAFIQDSLSLLRTDSLSGYYATKALAESANAQTNYPACYYAWNFTELPTPPTTTCWFLPSAPQWAAMMQSPGGLGGLKGLERGNEEPTKYDYVTWGVTFDRDTSCLSRLDGALTKILGDADFLGGGDDVHDYWYWSCSEWFNSDDANSPSAVTVQTTGFSPDRAKKPNGIYISDSPKQNTGIYVRPVLAF